MACKATYSNINIIEPGQEEPWGSEPREKAAVSDVYTEEENEYEAVDPALGARRRQMEQQEARAPKWEWRRGQRWILACATVLGVSVLLNLLLLTLGVVRYMEMASALERMQVENQLLQNVASGSFLIYSESHQLCVDVTAGGSLTAAPCAPGSPSQHFQWLSRGQLLNVAHQQCVAVPKQLSWITVRLEPCEAHRELQHWECRADGLLALAKENLYFNYGNNQNHVVMLYTGDGPWSRWVVYGSHEDLCFCSSHGSHRGFHEITILLDGPHGPGTRGGLDVGGRDSPSSQCQVLETVSGLRGPEITQNSWSHREGKMSLNPDMLFQTWVLPRAVPRVDAGLGT
ncbi:uncharacterized protein LOC101943941 isoform X2 [Chrysemys picta bellii]|uniref:uncharacterized protein LOC101943941 isoform X2 n=1 Tax=Chrysemys picta bellii TaxID=8478 RepID=UPI0032B28C9B